MKAIVHIGAPKTGSSTIQEFLFQNTDALAAQGLRFRRNVEGRGSQYEYPLAALASIGLLLPNEEQQIRYSSTDLATHQAFGALIEDELAANRAKWTEPTAIFSSEHIFPWLSKPEHIAALDRLFLRHFDNVRYILYIRDQEDLVVSEYSEILKRGSNLRMAGFLRRKLDWLNFEPRIRNWLQVVGRDRFDLRLLEPEFLVKGDLMSDFAAAAGFSLEGLQSPPRVNEKLTPAAAECLRALNERIPQLTHDGQFNPLRTGLVEALQDMSAASPNKIALPPDHRTHVERLVAAGNEKIRQDFFPDRNSLFTAKAPTGPLPRTQTMEQALDLASRVIIRLRLGQLPTLTAAERGIAQQRAPGGISNGIAPPPKPDLGP